MADRHGSVFVKKKHPHRLAHYIASAYNNALFALDRDVVGVKHFHNARRGAGEKVVFAQHYLSDVHGVKSVNVLFWVDRLDDRLVVKVFGKRELNKNTVNLFSGVQRVYQLKQLLLRRILGKSVFLRNKSDSFTGFLLVVNINARGGVAADYNHRKNGGYIIFLL